jgi:hypothetical protein
MAASFPGSVVTEPTAEIASQLVIKSSHMDQAYQEIVALENSMLGVIGVNRTFKSTSSSTVPLTIQGVSSQTANLLQLGSSASANDRFIFTIGGQLQFPLAGATAGIKFGTGTATSIYNDGSNSTILQAGVNTAAAFAVAAADGHAVFSVDTTNSRVKLAGDSTSTPSVKVHIAPASTLTTAAGGIQFGSDTAANLYRNASGQITSDAGLSIGNALVVKSSTTSDVVTFATAAPGVTLTTAISTDVRAVFAARYIEAIHGSAATGIILRRPDGARRLITIDNNDQINIAASGF